MDRRSALPVVRATVGLLGLIALGYQIWTSASAGTFDPLRFFAFFTVLSNLFAAFLLLAMATVWRDVHSRRVDLLRGAAVVYLVVTFVVVILFLSGEDLQVAVPWVDVIVHKLVPLYLVADWLLASGDSAVQHWRPALREGYEHLADWPVDPPWALLTGRQPMVWLVFPLVWVVATLVRGAIDGWYPYPFLDPAHGGYASVAVSVVGIFVGFLAIGAATMAVGNALRERRGGAAWTV